MQIKWQSNGKWIIFPVEDIINLPLSHFISLFSRPIPMVARVKDTVISNDQDVLSSYRKKKDITVIDLKEIQPSEIPLGQWGISFISAVKALN